MDFNVILIILGVIALVVLVAHGLWSHRREKSQYFQNANTFSREAENTTDFAQPKSLQTPNSAPESLAPTQQEFSYSENYSAQEPISTEQAVEQIRIRLPDEQIQSQASIQSQPQAPTYQSNQGNSASNFAHRSIAELEQEDIDMSSDSLRQALSEASYNQSLAMQQEVQLQPEPAYETQVEPQLTNGEAPQFMLLYVVAPEHREFHGTALAQAFEDLGFIYGESGLYHSHLDMSARSPVIFSVANINQPGSFDPYNLDRFYTVGVAFFMQLPSVGNDSANLKTMICAARNLAKQLGGFVLTDQHEIFNEMSEAAYLARLN